MGSPHHGSLWPVSKWGISIAKASRMVYPCAGTLPHISPGDAYITLMSCFPAARWTPSTRAAPYHRLYWHPSMCRACKAWHVLQPTPADTGPPQMPHSYRLIAEPWTACDFGQAHQGHCHTTRTRPIQVLWPQPSALGVLHLSGTGQALPVAN